MELNGAAKVTPPNQPSVLLYDYGISDIGCLADYTGYTANSNGTTGLKSDRPGEQYDMRQTGSWSKQVTVSNETYYVDFSGGISEIYVSDTHNWTVN